MNEIVKVEDPFEIPLDPSVVPPKIKRALAFQLRKVGIPYEVISEKLGVTIGTARNYVSSFIDESHTEKDRDQVIDLELIRLDELQAIAYQTAKLGDLKAIEAILKIMNQRAKYLGIGQQDGGSIGDVTNNVLVIGGSETDYIAGLQQAIESVEVS